MLTDEGCVVMDRYGTRLLTAFRDGDRLTDTELTRLRDDMDSVATTLSNYGDVFKLTRDYARQIEDKCTGFLSARRERRA